MVILIISTIALLFILIVLYAIKSFIDFMYHDKIGSSKTVEGAQRIIDEHFRSKSHVINPETLEVTNNSWRHFKETARVELIRGRYVVFVETEAE